MPQKTKKQKVIAQYRRKLQQYQDVAPKAQIQSPSPSNTSDPSTISPFTYHAPNQHTDNHSEIPGKTFLIDEKEFSAVKKDLQNTIILIVGLLIIQMTLWRIYG